MIVLSSLLYNTCAFINSIRTMSFNSYGIDYLLAICVKRVTCLDKDRVTIKQHHFVLMCFGCCKVEHGQSNMNMVNQIWTWSIKYEHDQSNMNIVNQIWTWSIKYEHDQSNMNMVNQIWTWSIKYEHGQSNMNMINQIWNNCRLTGHLRSNNVEPKGNTQRTRDHSSSLT